MPASAPPPAPTPNHSALRPDAPAAADPAVAAATPAAAPAQTAAAPSPLIASLAASPEKPATPGAAAPPALLDPAAAILPAQQSATPAPKAAAAAPAQPAAPAAQLVPAMIQIAHAAGGQQITLRLAPAELGRVDIRIDRMGDGPATIQVLVERPETLKLLQADQPQLNQALDKAGVPQEGRTLSLSLALPDPGGSNQNAGGQSGSPSGGARPPPTPPPSPAPTAYSAPVSAPAWQRAGINITA
jgi:flagellar hook-length control protein FliK